MDAKCQQRAQINKYIKPTQGMVHFLTGHGAYPTYLNKHGLRETDTCDCGERGTPEHVADEELFKALNELTTKISTIEQKRRQNQIT